MFSSWIEAPLLATICVNSERSFKVNGDVGEGSKADPPPSRNNVDRDVKFSKI